MNVNAHIHPFFQGKKYQSFYPYYIPRYYSNYYPRHYNRYYEPVSTVSIEHGPVTIQREPSIFQAHNFMIVFLVMILFFIIAFRAMRS